MQSVVSPVPTCSWTQFWDRWEARFNRKQKRLAKAREKIFGNELSEGRQIYWYFGAGFAQFDLCANHRECSTYRCLKEWMTNLTRKLAF